MNSKNRQREPMQDHIDAASEMFPHAKTNENVMDAARVFAAALLANEEMKTGPAKREGTEAAAEDVVRNGTPLQRAQRDIPDLDADTFERYGALKSLSEKINEDRAYDNEPEFAANSADANDILDQIAAAILDRRRR